MELSSGIEVLLIMAKALVTLLDISPGPLRRYPTGLLPWRRLPTGVCAGHAEVVRELPLQCDLQDQVSLIWEELQHQVRLRAPGLFLID